MVRATGERKLGRVICPDPWKSGARNTVGKCTLIYSLFSLFNNNYALVHMRKRGIR